MAKQQNQSVIAGKKKKKDIATPQLVSAACHYQTERNMALKSERKLQQTNPLHPLYFFS